MVDFATHTGRIIARLGQVVTVSPSDSTYDRQVRAVFVQRPEVAFGLVSGNNPTLQMTTADAVGLVQGDPLTVNDVAYTIASLRRDAVAGDVLIELVES